MHLRYALALIGCTVCLAQLPLASAAPQQQKKTVASAAKPLKVAAKPAAVSQTPVKAVQPTRIAVMRFSGPVAIDIDADEFWKIKNNRSQPSQGELSQVPGMLQRTLTAQLVDRLGTTVVPSAELEQTMASQPPAIGGNQYATLRTAVGAKYVVTGTIERIEFDGNTVTPDDYILIVSTQVIDTSTGQTVWSEELHKFKTDIYTKRTGKTVGQNFAGAPVTDTAEYMCNSIAGALGR